MSFDKQKMKYSLKISKRARQMRLEVRQNGELVVTVPRGMDYHFVEKFIAQKAEWIKNALGYFNSVKDKVFLNTNKREYLKYKEMARALVENRIAYYNRDPSASPISHSSAYKNFIPGGRNKISRSIYSPPLHSGLAGAIEYKPYNFKINRISIKNTKSRWGSCSKKGNLNFSYKIALLSKDLADYVIVHELCHLGEFNHSKRFWKLVSLTIPNYLELKNRFHI